MIIIIFMTVSIKGLPYFSLVVLFFSFFSFNLFLIKFSQSSRNVKLKKIKFHTFLSEPPENQKLPQKMLQIKPNYLKSYCSFLFPVSRRKIFSTTKEILLQKSFSFNFTRSYFDHKEVQNSFVCGKGFHRAKGKGLIYIFSQERSQNTMLGSLFQLLRLDELLERNKKDTNTVFLFLK